MTAADCCAGEPAFGDPQGLHTADCPVYLANMDVLERLRPVSTTNPTPNPRPEWITAAAEAIEDVAIRRIGRDLGTVHRDEIVAAGLAAVLPAIRAEVAEEIAAMLGTFAANRREQNPKDLVAAAYRAAARHVREYAGKGLSSNAPALSGPAEGSAHPHPFPGPWTGPRPTLTAEGDDRA